GNSAHMCGELLTDCVRKRPDERRDSVIGILRFERQVKANEPLVVLHELECLGARTDFLRDAIQFVIEDIAQAFGEDERENELLVFGRVLRAANGAGGIPNPGFKRFVRGVGHLLFWEFFVCRVLLSHANDDFDLRAGQENWRQANPILGIENLHEIEGILVMGFSARRNVAWDRCPGFRTGYRRATGTPAAIALASCFLAWVAGRRTVKTDPRSGSLVTSTDPR